MGKRSRQRGRRPKAGDGLRPVRGSQELRAPTAAYEHASFGVLELRGALSPGTRREYAELPARTREDAWQRAVEFLFERLAARWTVAGVAYERQAELLARYRMAGPDERAWIRDVLREHVAGHFPDIEAP